MPNGGPWVPADVDAADQRPGFYINFIQSAQAAVQPGVRGIVGIIGEADWGPENSLEEFSSLAEAATAYVNFEDATHRLYNQIRLAFMGGAQTVKAIRALHSDAVLGTITLNDTTGSPLQSIRVDAKYKGTYGNNISLIIGDDPIDATKTRIRVYVEDSLVHDVTTSVNHGSAGFTDNVVALFAALASPWVVFTKLVNGNNDLADHVTALSLASGSNGGAVTTGDFDTALGEFAATRIQLLTADTVSPSIQTTIQTWVDDQRASGYRVVAVLGSDLGDSAATITADAQGFNDPYIVYTGPGARMPGVAGTSTVYKGATIAAMVAGMIAGVGTTRSVSYMGLETATNVETQLTNDQVKSMLAAGVLVIAATPSNSNPGARIERGLTTLYNPSDEDVADYKLIRTVEIVDAISDGLSDAAESSFIGTQLNDATGRQAILDAVHDFLRLQEESRAIATGWTAIFDPLQESTGPNVFLQIAIQPVDAIEFIYATIQLS